jgi:hypothetical protein
VTKLICLGWIISSLEDDRQAQSKYTALLPCTNLGPVCHSNKKILGRVALGFWVAVVATSDLKYGITFVVFCS